MGFHKIKIKRKERNTTNKKKNNLAVNKSESDYQNHVSTESHKHQVFWKTVKESKTLILT